MALTPGGPVVVVCGSREWADAAPIRAHLYELQPSIVIEGGALGADRLARIEAQGLGIHVATVAAQWERYRKAAGPRRNLAMIDLRPDRVLAFWVGGSPGTKHMIDLAKKAGVAVEVVRP